MISIHALLAESDSFRQLQSALYRDFYPRSPCGERRVCWTALNRQLRFLSTLSLRRATYIIRYPVNLQSISIHALLAESDHPITVFICVIKDFYPRSPCGERHDTSSLLKCQVKFLSTLSLRRATKLMPLTRFCLGTFLSTLSLRRATSQQPAGTTRTTYFYPRSPCGERPTDMSKRLTKLGFLSTLSLRRATRC